MHILFVTFFNLFVFHLQVRRRRHIAIDRQSTPTTDDWLVQVTQLIDNYS